MGADDPFRAGRVLIVSAHPDDEVIGAGGQLARLRDRIEIVEVTDGSPDGNPEYAAARKHELESALTIAGIEPRRCHRLGFRDQDTSFHLVELAERLSAFHPNLVVTHPYEGGHPDHDSCAFAAAAAFRGICPLYEFTSYHAAPDRIETGRFLDNGGGVVHFPLTDEQRHLKQRMFDCFVTQREVLADFAIDAECFRPAPLYDFTAPPHCGQLYYERFEWGVTGARWRELAGAAIASGIHL